MEEKTIIITGNPVDGLAFYGPFEDSDEATEWAENNLKGEDWWTGNLQKPEPVTEKTLMSAEVNGWLVNTSDDGQYLYVQRDGAPGQIHIKADDEGFVVDAWSDDEEPEVMGTMGVEYMQLERE